MQLHKTDAILYLKDSCQLAYGLGSAAHEKPCLRPCNEMPCISASSCVCNMCLHLLKHMARGPKNAHFQSVISGAGESCNHASPYPIQQHSTVALISSNLCSSIHGRAQGTEARSTKADQAEGMSTANEVQA